MAARSLTYQELYDMTDGFDADRIVGQGSYGVVYWVRSLLACLKLLDESYVQQNSGSLKLLSKRISNCFVKVCVLLWILPGPLNREETVKTWFPWRNFMMSGQRRVMPVTRESSITFESSTIQILSECLAIATTVNQEWSGTKDSGFLWHIYIDSSVSNICQVRASKKKLQVWIWSGATKIVVKHVKRSNFAYLLLIYTLYLHLQIIYLLVLTGVNVIKSFGGYVTLYNTLSLCATWT